MCVGGRKTVEEQKVQLGLILCGGNVCEVEFVLADPAATARLQAHADAIAIHENTGGRRDRRDGRSTVNVEER